MSIEKQGLQAAAPESAAHSFLDGVWSSLRSPVDGARQIGGAQIDTSHNGSGLAGEVGKFAGAAVLYLGSTALASRIPVIGRFAPITAGATLGFLTPTDANGSMLTRLENAGIGGSTAAILQFGPGALKGLGMESRLGQFAASSAGAGELGTNLESLQQTGHLASLQDTGLSAGTWAATGLLMGAVGSRFMRGGAAENARGNEQRSAMPATIASNWEAGSGEYARPEAMPVTAEMQGKPLKPGFYRVQMESDGLPRMYDLHVPEGYDPSRPTPLVVMMDGVSPNSPGQMPWETRFNALGDQDNVLVAYPYALQNRSIPLAGKVFAWNEPGSALTNAQPHYSDFRFLDNTLQDISSRVNVDQSRVAGVGFSEGSLMMQRYATQRPGVFNTIASVHGTLFGNEQIPRDVLGNPVHQNAIVIHSQSDYMLPRKGGRGLMTVFLPNAAESKPTAQAPFWAKVNETQAPALIESTPAYDQTTYFSNDGQHRVTEYVVTAKGAGHAWDGSPAKGLPIVGRPVPATVFDASRKVWDFVLQSNIQRGLDANAAAA